MSSLTDTVAKLEGFVKQVKTSTDSGWKSRKLWITVGAVVAFVFLFKATLPIIVWPVTFIIMVYLFSQALVDIEKEKTKREVKIALYGKLAEDGLTVDELELVRKALEE
jgi:hypothetical protein